MFLARFHGRIPSGRPFLMAARFHSSPGWLAPKLQKFNLADIGEGITECEVISWCVENFVHPLRRTLLPRFDRVRFRMVGGSSLRERFKHSTFSVKSRATKLASRSPVRLMVL